MSVRRPLASLPELAIELDDARFSPTDLGVSAATVVWWRCAREHRHRWMADVKARAAGVQRAQCPWCHGVAFLPDEHNPSLQQAHPDLAAEWDCAAATVGLPPAELITASTNLSINWRCPRNKFHDHILTTPGGRAFGEHPSCRHCWANDHVVDVEPGTAFTRRAGGLTSQAERRLFDQLARHLRLSSATLSERRGHSSNLSGLARTSSSPTVA